MKIFAGLLSSAVDLMALARIAVLPFETKKPCGEGSRELGRIRRAMSPRTQPSQALHVVALIGLCQNHHLRTPQTRHSQVPPSNYE
jgi:hypothetical protein